MRNTKNPSHTLAGGHYLLHLENMVYIKILFRWTYRTNFHIKILGYKDSRYAIRHKLFVWQPYLQ